MGTQVLSRNRHYKLTKVLAKVPTTGLVTYPSQLEARVVIQHPVSSVASRGAVTELDVRSTITSGQQQFILYKPINCTISSEDGVWSYECDELEIYSYGLTKDDSKKDFDEDFASAWNEIALEDDDKLTVDAQLLKKQLKSLVMRIVDA